MKLSSGSTPPPATTQTGQAEVVAFLTALAGAPAVETHISHVFLGPHTAWKLKKAVRLSFLDFSSIEARRRFCERELALNGRAAPGLYRDVVPVVRRPGGYLALGGPGEPIDWVLRMARVPADDFIDVRAAMQGLPSRLLDEIADSVAAFHTSLSPAPAPYPDMAEIVEGNALAALSAGLPEADIDIWRSRMRARLSARSDWIAARAGSGFIRRCHGDLHLANLCLWHGRPVLFDALEFDEALATIDTAYDLAFLLMDLEHRVNRAAANRVLNRYVARTGDADLVAGLPMFLSMRAMIRAHVSVRSGQPLEGTKYLAAAADYLTPCRPVVIAVGGLPGTGKSTLARALAPFLGPAPGALIPRSDEIRKRQHGAAPERRLPGSAYTPVKSVAVFSELTRQVETAARGGQAVIADATFLAPAHRMMVEDAATHAGVPFVGLWLSAPHSELERRVAARKDDASDATVAVLRAAAPHDPGAGTWRRIDTTDSGAALALAKAVLAPYITV